MDDNGVENKSLIGTLMAAAISIIGYLFRGKLDNLLKKLNSTSENRRKAATEIYPFITKYIDLSNKLCAETSSSTEPNHHDCIKAYDTKCCEFLDLKKILSKLSNQNCFYFDEDTEKKIEKMNSLLSTHLQKLIDDFDIVDGYRGDHEEVLRTHKDLYKELL